MNVVQSLSTMSRMAKRRVLLAFDTLLIPIAFYCAFCLRFGTPYPTAQWMAAWPLPLVLTLLAPLVLLWVRSPDVKLRSLDVTGLARIVISAFALALMAAGLSYFALMVIFTMFAVSSFDSRLLWDIERRSVHAKP
ncbi:MAG: hypothetical protein ACPGRD_08345 [Planktomarina sp.]